MNPSHIAENTLNVMQDRLVDIADREATSNGERRALVALEMVKPLLIVASVPLALANPAIAVPLGIVMGSGPAFAQAAIADSPEEKDGYIIEGLIGAGAEVGGQVAGQALKGVLGKGAKAYRAFANNLDDAPTPSGSFRPNGSASDHSSSVQPRRQNTFGQGFRGETRRLEDWGEMVVQKLLMRVKLAVAIGQYKGQPSGMCLILEGQILPLLGNLGAMSLGFRIRFTGVREMI
ncbi:hypothetical protein GCM10007938_35800 [Vibrio zhanjiangensis]|uniref:Uncharacterized protein n=1 Tax=Vibrio zhanjiangensis TaxID=1046128 RepID=A0ABQ6F524_9VIBR|nr:hypothetical protein [Vibrio zhanjiangensis]GLT19797.1 hypothetical protein GCM10007938_35800 [Vibrio zhanjiangensis]